MRNYYFLMVFKYTLRKFFFILCIFRLSSLIASDENMEDESFLISSDPLFVSLGSTCEPAQMLKSCELRKCSLPFDWIVSLDGEALIEILENDFKNFLNEECFQPYGPAGHLLHTYYHLEFLHEGDFNRQFETNLAQLKIKYQRRIERFRSLKNYQGKVFFIRNAFIYSMTDPHRFFRSQDNLEISEEYALRLYQALKYFFPMLHFDLIIINCRDGESFTSSKNIAEHVRIIKSNPLLDQDKKIENYKIFFNELLLFNGFN